MKSESSTSTTPARRSISDGVVHLWVVPLDQVTDKVARATLTRAERARAVRLLRSVDRNRFIVARIMLRKILSEYLGSPPAEIRFVTGPHGKPAIDPSQTTDLFFNISHSGDLALIGISRFELGVDLEQIRAEVDCSGISERFYSPSEKMYLNHLAGDHQRNSFFSIWAAKEAYCKARGMGLHLPTDVYTVLLSDEPPWSVDDATVPPSERPSVYPLIVAPGFAAAFASVAPVTRFQMMKFPSE